MAFIIPNQTSTSLLKPVINEAPWTRPGDWITINDTAGEVQFLFCDATSPYLAIETQFTQTGGVGNIYIDWGDGITTTISTTSLTTTQKQYLSGGTPSVLGYDMWKIRVYGDAGTTITNCKVIRNQSYFGQAGNPVSLLEAVYGDGTQTLGFNSLFNGPGFYYLEYVKLPSTITTAGAIFSSAFVSAFGLKKVVLPTSAPNATSFLSAFQNCNNLLEAYLPQDAILITTFQNAFNSCNSIKSITLPPTLNNVVDMNSAFNGCYSLTSIEIPPTPLNRIYSNMFFNCVSLISYDFKSFPTSIGAITLDNCFNGCVSLEYVKLPSVVPVGSTLSLNGAFSNCFSLQNCVLPNNLPSVANGLASTFNNCASISAIVMPTTTTNITSLSNTFTGCRNLQSISLPTTTGAVVDMTNTFQDCSSLAEVVIPSGYTITSANQTFRGCANLRKAHYPNNAQNSLNNMSNTFNGCINLRDLVLPTSLNGLTTLLGCFNNCISIEEITFPSSLPALTTISTMCNVCRSLKKITLPSSAPLLTIATNAFSSSSSLKSITMPTNANITNFANFANNAISLTTINLPSTQSTSLTSINGLLSQTWGLTGSTNFDKLGNTSTAATIYIDGSNNTQTNIPSLDFYCKFSALNLSGQGSAITRLSSLRLRNNGAGQYGGASPQVNLQFTSLGQAALVQVFNDLPTITSKTINITGSIGAASLTPAERAIATGKGWTIIG